MAVSYRTIGGSVTSTVGTINVPYPATVTAGDILFMPVHTKYGECTHNTPANWGVENSCIGGNGAPGNDSGSLLLTVFKATAVGTEGGGTVPVIITGAPNTSMGIIIEYQNANGNWEIASTKGSDTTAGTAWSATGIADPGVVINDICLAISSANGNLALSYSAELITQTGLTFGSMTERMDYASSSGSDSAMVISEHPVTAGTATDVPTFTMTGSGSGANSPTGPTIFIRMREGSAATNITPAEAAQAQTSDIAPVIPIYVIASAEGVQSQLSDPASLAIAIGPAEAAQAQASDAAVITAIYPVTPAEATQAQASDAAIITAITPLAPAEAAQAQTSDAALLAPIYLLTPAEAGQAQTSDAGVISQDTYITPAEATQSQLSDAVTLTVTDLIAPAEASQSQISDAAILAAVYPVTPAEAAQTQISDAAPISFQEPGGATNITPAEANQAQTSDAVTVTAMYLLTPEEAAQGQASDAATLTAIYGITATEATQTQASDEAAISFTAPTWTIASAEALQAQAFDIPGLGVVYILDPAEALQAQLSDLAIVTVQGVFEHGARRTYEFDARGTSVFASRPTHEFAERKNLEVDD